ncbi:ABC transporter ATP-binding protein [Fuerstiella marisgermanici]|uniref:Daunorubicin/doxorubicin resistance ATP-binding protein DrrA n=1 Tax=Fuerstiella marisgermanici TaxID=1891926 RepID=A0A1P8WHE5_9PLAN|nr:ATP-binding cassette domain-containing protein [Fuerstiella marisgermanici]APZ93475.1 Daunorubicin/doxorubicin resistance ATP-binding protein DrrA [Fuerstiella marisgermanici]
MNHAVELVGATKRFGSQTAVDNLDLTVPRGSIYGFIGPNGSGKTTTLRMILRIFQPDSGSVSVLGKTAGRAADPRVGYLPEERGLYKRMKVFDLCAYYAKLKGVYDCKPAIDEWLERLDATSWANKRIDALSKGMAQKVSFITAVVARPELLILDEPFSGLDPVNLDVLRDAVLSLRETGTTVIFSTHDMDVAERMCDTIFMIFKGRKVLNGSVDEIRKQYATNRLSVRLRNIDSLPSNLPGVTRIDKVNDEILLSVRDESVSSDVLKTLVEAGCEIDRFELEQPTLHNVFVSIAKPDTNGEAT